MQPKQQSSEKKDDEDLLRRNLVLGDAAAAKRLRSVRLNKPTITKKMRLSPRNSPAAPLWLLPLSRPSMVAELFVPPAQPQRPNRPLAERLEPQPFVQRITTERVTVDPRKRAAPQEFSGASIGGPSVYEEYQQARDTLANVNLPKSAHNLRPLEVAFTARAEGKKRQKKLAGLTSHRRRRRPPPLRRLTTKTRYPLDPTSE